jgi:hypothetical protein
MKTRCLNPKATGYSYYGGRGITICERWLTFANFLEDMGVRPEGLTLDRIDGSKGYSKENCQWASRAAQQRNRRPRVTRLPQVLELRAQGVSYAEITTITGMKTKTARNAIYKYNKRRAA